MSYSFEELIIDISEAEVDGRIEKFDEYVAILYEELEKADKENNESAIALLIKKMQTLNELEGTDYYKSMKMLVDNNYSKN